MSVSRRSFLRAAGAAPLAAQTAASPPNFVFLISDDHSAPHLGCYGDPHIHTPNLDRLARDGMRFNSAFVSSPQCSPNRSGILTGCIAHTTNTSRLHTPMPPWEQTFLEPLKERGYFTGAFRKVHQGPEFDKRWNFAGNEKTPFAKFFDSRPKNQPFFLHVGFTDPHRPYSAGAFRPPHDPAKVSVPAFLPDSREIRADLANYYDEIARMDAECGEVLRLIEQHGAAQNTLVIFTADNGMPFPRAKGTCYDSGLRVPLIARWPGRVQPGSVKRELISHLDLAETWLDAAGAPIPKKMQGRSFLSLLAGRPYQPRDAVFATRNWHDNFDPSRAVRTERYKLIYNGSPATPYRPIGDLAESPTWQSYLTLGRAGRLSAAHRRLLDPSRPAFELYDIETDPAEFYNLAASAEHQQTLESLKRRLSDWMHETYDYLPPPYRAYPAREGEQRTTTL